MTERLFDRPPPEAGLWMQVWADTFLSALEEVPAIQEALTDAIADAEAAADNANAAAASVTAEQAIVTSFPTNYTPPLIEADNTGLVTIANHDRQYGGTPPPTPVAVTGDTVATAAASGSIVRIYYDDPARTGGAVVYAFTVDPADPPVQGGDRHSVGVVEIPFAGTTPGTGLPPPGTVQP